MTKRTKTEKVSAGTLLCQKLWSRFSGRVLRFTLVAQNLSEIIEDVCCHFVAYAARTLCIVLVERAWPARERRRPAGDATKHVGATMPSALHTCGGSHAQTERGGSHTRVGWWEPHTQLCNHWKLLEKRSATADHSGKLASRRHGKIRSQKG